MRTSESMRRSAAVEFLTGEDCSFVDSVEFTVDQLELMVRIMRAREADVKLSRRVKCARCVGGCNCEDDAPGPSTPPRPKYGSEVG